MADYEPVGSEEKFTADDIIAHDQRGGLIESPKYFGARTRMVSFLLVGLAIALAHHFVYVTLNNRSADGTMFSHVLRDDGISNQSVVSSLGNLISQVGAACLSIVIGTAFEQLFWWWLRTKGSTIKRVDLILSFKESPLNIFSWPAVFQGFRLSLVAIVAALMALVTVFAPGSLGVESTTFRQSCNVSNVDLSRASLTGVETQTNGLWTYNYANGVAYSHILRVLMAGTYFTPPSPCGVCQYNLSFVAPAVQCANITQASDVNSLLPVVGSGPTGSATVWYSSYDNGNLVSQEIASRNILGTSPLYPDMVTVDKLPVVVLSCTGWNATYHVTVSQNTTTTVTTNSVDIGQQLMYKGLLTTPNIIDHQVLALWDAFGWQLRGNVDYYFTSNAFNNDPSYVAFSYLGRGSTNGIAWQWPGDLNTLIPSLMANISLSLLSGAVADDNDPSLVWETTPCDVEGLRFVYNRKRLIATYSTALAVTAVLLVCGLIAVHYDPNRRSETLDFSRIFAAELIAEPGMAITKDTPVRSKAR